MLLLNLQFHTLSTVFIGTISSMLESSFAQTPMHVKPMLSVRLDSTKGNTIAITLLLLL